MAKAIFLDRDGCLVEDPGYVHKIEDFKLIDGVIEGLNLLKEKFAFIIVTNQSGIQRGYFTEEDFKKFNGHLTSESQKENIEIKKTYYSTSHPDKPDKYRKPGTASIEDAQKEFGINPKESWVIGDHLCDIEMGKKAGCKTILVLTGKGEKYKAEVEKLQPDCIAKDLLDAAQFILKK